jgi:hypothetical protein
MVVEVGVGVETVPCSEKERKRVQKRAPDRGGDNADYDKYPAQFEYKTYFDGSLQRILTV